MDIKQLSYFVAVAQEGSYSKAAEKVNLSQPALSIAIKKLEKELGVALFYTFERRQRLTEEGERLLAGARDLISDYHRTVESVKNVRLNEEGAFTLGLSPLFGSCFFAELIPEFNHRYPNIKISLVEDGAGKINEAIENGSVDLAVTLRTEGIQLFEHTHFTIQRNMAVFHESHPLAYAKEVCVSDLRNEKFAIFNQDFILNKQIIAACSAAGFRPEFALLSSQWDFMVELAARNQAVAILPKPILMKHTAASVRYVPMGDSMKYWDVVLAWNRSKYMPQSCQLFLEYLKENLPPDDL